MPDPQFAHPRLAAIYDVVDGDRTDLDHHHAIVDEFSATSVLDIGCGTGSFAVQLAASDIDVIGLDPAKASLDIARRKKHAGLVRWVHGDVTALPLLNVDLAVMTGNVAQVFLEDEDWHHALSATHSALRPDGHLVFETRNVAAHAWLDWAAAQSSATINTSKGPVETSLSVTEVALPYVSFDWTYRFTKDGQELVSSSTLRFRSRDELDTSLDANGFDVVDVREAPDRPGKEWVYVAQRRSGHSSNE